MAGEKDATVQVEDEGLITVELPAGLAVDDDDNGEPVSLQDLHEAVTTKPTGEPKTPKETVQRQPRRTAVDEAAEALARNIADTRKRLVDSRAQVDAPFEYAERLASLIQRQRQIEDELDLTKNQASSRLEADTADAPAPDEKEVEEPVEA